MIRPSRVYSSSSTGASCVYYEKRRKKWRVQICFRGKLHFLGYYATKEDAIKARIEGESKYWNPMLEKKQLDVDSIDKKLLSKWHIQEGNIIFPKTTNPEHT